MHVSSCFFFPIATLRSGLAGLCAGSQQLCPAAPESLAAASSGHECCQVGRELRQLRYAKIICFGCVAYANGAHDGVPATDKDRVWEND